MERELVSKGYKSTGRGWTGVRFEDVQKDSQSIHITSVITKGIKPAIGRDHTLMLTADETENLIEQLTRNLEMVRFHESRHASAE